MSVQLSEVLEPVENYIGATYLVAFDGCHKIYMAFDRHQADWFRDEYPHTVEGDQDKMLEAIQTWWDESCVLKFVSGVVHDAEDPNRGFTQVVPQGAEAEEDCTWCGGDCEDADECWEKHYGDDDEEE